MGPESLTLCDQSHRVRSTGVDLHVAEWTAAEKPFCSALILHGTGSHMGYYGRFANALRNRGVHVWGVDFKGHGRSGGSRGVFTLSEMVQNAGEVARFIRARSDLPLAVIGTSQGGEVAFHALQACAELELAVCHNLLLSAEHALNFKVHWLRGRSLGLLSGLVPWLPVPLRLAFNWKKAYLDPELLEEKRRDPLTVWSYSLASYRSVFTTRPVIPPAGNHKPVLVACGERDEIVTPEHCLKCFTAIGGPKEFYVMPGAAHQLVIDYSEAFADVVVDFFHRSVQRVAPPVRSSWGTRPLRWRVNGADA